MSDSSKEPSNSEILTARRWRQQKDLVNGVETRLGSKIDAGAERLDQRLTASEERMSERLAREIQDRPVVVHIDMSRVTELEKQLEALAKRVADLETAKAPH